MVILRNKILLAFGAVIVAAGCICLWKGMSDSRPPKNLEAKVKEMAQWCEKYGCSGETAVLVDYSVRSGKKRLFVVSLKNGKILYSSRCAHGCGGGSTSKIPVFSNNVGSNCSCVGHFKIGEIHTLKGSRYKDNALRLTGLDTTNSNARQRGILIHPSKVVSCCGLFTHYLPVGNYCEGCFAIENRAFLRLRDETVKNTSAPIGLWAYYDL